MNEPSDRPDASARPQDYAGLRAELAELVNDFLPVADELWPRLQDHKYLWHSPNSPDSDRIQTFPGFINFGVPNLHTKSRQRHPTMV